jgi:hypothetical protein
MLAKFWCLWTARFGSDPCEHDDCVAHRRATLTQPEAGGER